MEVKRGSIVLVDFDPVVGSEQGKTRPALVIQNDIYNKYSPTTIVAPITSKIFTKEFSTNVEIGPEESGLRIKSRILKNVGSIFISRMKEADRAIKVSLGLESDF